MCSDLKYIALTVIVLAVSCSPVRRLENIRSGEVGMLINVADEKPLDDEPAETVVVDSIRSSMADEPFIMNAIKDTETGEMVATDVICASTVTARFRNVAERLGYVSISFDVNVPAMMSDSQWQLKLRPRLSLMNEVLPMDPLYITGKEYREGQLRGYERYRRFISTIITDSTDFIRENQLDIFLKRHFPDTYAMKTDSSFVSDPEEENLFGTTQTEALHHYTMKLRKSLNERRKSRKSAMFDRYVKDPIIREGIKLDTVLNTESGDFVYRYTHTFRSRPHLKKVIVSMEGGLYENGRLISDLPPPEDLTFYISSLSTLADCTPRYKMQILERIAYDNTKAFLDFRQGSAEVDTTLSGNAAELARIRRCVADVASRHEYALDSLMIVASCSPEGPLALNRRLSSRRAGAVRDYIVDFVPEEWRDSLMTSAVPENWDQFIRLVRNDTVMSSAEKKRILRTVENMNDPDEAERKLAGFPQYRYLREKIYPKLRSVSFDFYLHRVGMVKDTVDRKSVV